MKIITLKPGDTEQIRQTADLLAECFLGAWTAGTGTLDEVMESLLPGRVSLAAVNDGGEVIGWVGGRPQYGGNVWELHPLAVATAHRLRGVGRALVQALEREASTRGGITMILGADDEEGRTSLGGIDIYPKIYDDIRNIRNLHGHPFEFYQKLGYAIVGVIPDANGWGKPDILMAKRLQKDQHF